MKLRVILPEQNQIFNDSLEEIEIELDVDEGYWEFASGSVKIELLTSKDLRAIADAMDKEFGNGNRS